MPRRRRSLADGLLLAVVAASGVLLAVSLALALRPEDDAAPAGAGVYGTVIASPCRSAEQVGDPPCPGYYGEIRILRRDESVVMIAHTDRSGHYRVELPPGRYIVDPNDDGKSLANRHGYVTVREGRFSRVDLRHYTGMICALGRTYLHVGLSHSVASSGSGGPIPGISSGGGSRSASVRTGRPAARQASKPPTMSVAFRQPSSRSPAAAKLDE